MAGKPKKKQSAAERVKNNPPPLVPVQTASRPIGVGSDYVAQLGQSPVKPRYFSGAENTEVAGLTVEDRAQLQVMLRDLGLIAPKAKIRLGVWDSTSSEAFRQVLAWANSTGKDWKDALTDMASGASSIGTEPAVAAVRQATNPLDFEALAKSKGTEVLGRRLTDAEKHKVGQKLAAKETAYLPSDNTVSAPGSGAFNDMAEEQVRALDPVRADSRGVVKVASVIARMLGGDMPSQAGTL